MRRSRNLLKRYGVIFTCPTVRAAHIEVAHRFDTDSFLLALICEVESILNSSPITVLSDYSRDLEPLTPNHLLLLNAPRCFPKGTSVLSAEMAANPISVRHLLEEMV